jgi:methylmalonyl-CoA/ethylmalonyl-CoA epimerase
VHHIGLVTDDLERARHVLCDGFGLAIDEHRTPRPEGRRRQSDGATLLEFPIGEMYYEVARPRSGDTSSKVARFLASTGGRGGVQYLAIASDDPGGDVERLRSLGASVLPEKGERGAVFLDPASCLGLSIAVVPEERYYVHPFYRGNGVTTGMAHIGIAARDAAEVRRLWGSVFGLPEEPREARDPGAPREPSQAIDPVQLIEFPLGGTVIEISIPLSDDSGTARLVQNRAPLGAVWHHTCPFAPDVYRFMAQATEAGLQQIGTLPEPATTRLVVGWLHPRSCLGMLIEVWNRAPGAGHTLQYRT